MATIEELRADVIWLHEQRTRLERERDLYEWERRQRLRLLQEACPHDRVVELKGDVKHPGEKSFKVEMRACMDCNYTEPAGPFLPPYEKLASPKSVEHASYYDSDKYQVLGCTL
jgi:hypothetical protein